MKNQMLLIFFLFYAGIVLPQEKTDQAKLESLYQEGQTAYLNKEYTRAAALYLELAALPEAAEWRGGLLYNVSCCYSLLRDTGMAFDYLHKAIDAGYTDYRWIKGDTDFSFLRQIDSVRFEKLLAFARTAALNEQFKKSPIAIIEYDNYIGPRDISKYTWDDFRCPTYDSLRTIYHLDDVVKHGTTEFDKMKLILNWVATRWKHRSDHRSYATSAVSIISRANTGERFACIDYGIVLQQCLNALGYPSRHIGACRQGSSYGIGKGHTVTEVWSNQFQKWIVLDGQNNAWWEADGIPLNALECRRLILLEKDERLQFVGQHTNVNYTAIEPEWSPYYYHLFVSYRNSFFTPNNPGDPVAMELISDGVRPELYLDGQPYNLPLTDDSTELYPKLNQTSIQLRHVNTTIPCDTLMVRLTHTMPFFKQFMVRIDGKEWKVSPNRFQWILEKGNNTIEAKAINWAGIEGKTSRIVLRNNIGNTHN